MFAAESILVSPSPSVAVPARRAPASAPPAAAPRVVRSKYDAAITSAENAKHWAMADGLSAREANSADVRYRLRTRARYEIANNSYAKGIVETRANDLIGTGPRLQMLTGDPAVDRRIEAEFEAWTAAVGLAEKLRTLTKAKVGDGEAFALLINNPRLSTPVRLDLRPIEADQVATPDLAYDDPDAVDGIRFDAAGNPVEYHVMRAHPGDGAAGADGWGAYDRVPARSVLHWFRVDRPGQARGVPEITPAIPLFAQLRRYTLAVLAAAETAADLAAVVYSELPPDGEAARVDALDGIEIERRLMVTLPAGWKMHQFKAEQPATTYAMFKAEILNEIARCLNMPFNVAAGNSAGYNYASGRLDHQTYYKAIGVDQYHLETAVLDRVFAAWLEEAYLVAGIVPEPPGRLAGWPHQWFWDGHEHVDPGKEAAAQATRLANHTTTLADEYARRGLDWESQLRQRAAELALMAELGLGVPAPSAATTAPANAPTGGSDADSEDD